MDIQDKLKWLARDLDSIRTDVSDWVSDKERITELEERESELEDKIKELEQEIERLNNENEAQENTILENADAIEAFNAVISDLENKIGELSR